MLHIHASKWLSNNCWLSIGKYQTVILWWQLNSTNCFLYAVLTMFFILYFSWSSSRHRCCWRMCRLGKIALMKCPPFGNQAERGSLGISWKLGRRISLRRNQFCWIWHLGWVNTNLLFTFGDHSCVSGSGVGRVLHDLCSLTR